MKTALIASLLVLSTAAMADVIDARQYSCDQLQETLKTDGAIAIKGLFGADVHYATSNQCGAGERAVFTYIRSSDKRFCALGYTCQADVGGG